MPKFNCLQSLSKVIKLDKHNFKYFQLFTVIFFVWITIHEFKFWIISQEKIMLWHTFPIRILLFTKCLHDHGSVEWESCDKIHINLYGLMYKRILICVTCICININFSDSFIIIQPLTTNDLGQLYVRKCLIFGCLF